MFLLNIQCAVFYVDNINVLNMEKSIIFIIR